MWGCACGTMRVPIHLMTYLRRFRGLGSYDEEFIERAHQEGCKMEKRSANIKDANIKACLHSSWERLGTNPMVEESINKYQRNRRKRKADDSRNVETEKKRAAKKEVKLENRRNAKDRQSGILT